MSESSLVGLPFRLMRDGGRPFLQYEANFGSGQFSPCWLYDYEPEFAAVCRLLEQYRVLEAKLRDVEKERDDAREEIGKMKTVVAHKDKALAGYESQLERYRRPKVRE